MDSRCSRFSVSGADLSHPTVSSDLLRLFKSSKIGSGNSLNAPLSNTEALSTYSDCQEHNGSSENLSEVSPSGNSPLNHNCYLQQSRTSALHRQGSLSSHSGGQPSLPNENNGQNIQHALQTLEIALMAADDDEEVSTSELHLRGSTGGSSSEQKQETQGSHSHQSESSHGYRFGVSSSTSQVHIQKQHNGMEDLILQGVPPNCNLKQLLIACAQALSEDRLDKFERLVEYARARVSISGDPIQRLGAYMLEGLIARRELSGTNIYWALKCDEPASKDLLSYMQILYEICPYLKFGYMAANGAIAEACKDEARIHIVDFQIAQGTQWMTLLQALAARPRGAPHVRITGIDDPVSKHARGDCLAAVGRRFASVSEKFNIPVDFHAVPAFAPDVRIEMLEIRPGEALAVNFPLQLHHIPDESVDVSNPRDGLLRMVKSLSPKVVTLVEQESNTNTAPFLPRFKEALDFYSAMFESIDVILARDRKERISVEQHCLARDIVNIIACEGRERVERHELLGKWRSRFMMAGFQQIPLSSYINSVIRGLLRCYSDKYTLVEKHGAMLLGWQDRHLISASAWH